MPVPLDLINEQDPKCHHAKIGALAQINLLRGLKREKDNDIRVITTMPDGKGGEIDLGNNINARVVPNWRSESFGIFLASLIPTNTVAFFSEMRKMKRLHKNEKVIVMTLNTALPFSVPVLLSRIFYKNITWCPFLVDSIETPHYGNILFRIASRFSVWVAKHADASITYNVPNSTDYIPNKPYLELLFGVNKKDMKLYKEYKLPKNKKFTIAYVGALTDIYNFKAIIQVIQNTGKKYHWIFAGYGPNEDVIRKLSRDNKYDVEYLGVLSHDEAIKLHKRADLLLCLRLSDGSKVNSYSARYATSGKLTEYLCSGTPVLATEIGAVSPQIKPFLNLMTETSAKAIRSKIEDIVKSYKQETAKAKDGQSFVFDMCSEKYQNEAVNDFIANLDGQTSDNSTKCDKINRKMNWILILLYVSLTAGGLILLKLGTGGKPLVSSVEGQIIWNIGIVSILGLFCYGVSFLLYMFLVSKFDLGYIVPLTTGLVYILVFAASFLVFKEAFSVIKVFAICLVISGVILLNLKSK
jgi:glycosyltransferase involved in cell wall biosynthesis/multidrug transporter EmrE-like cation transporter